MLVVGAELATVTAGGVSEGAAYMFGTSPVVAVMDGFESGDFSALPRSLGFGMIGIVH
jgi:hypothetical protein